VKEKNNLPCTFVPLLSNKLMKNPLLLLLLSLCCFFSYANKIDSLKTQEDVLAFIKPILQKNLKIDQLDISFTPLDNSCNLSYNQSLKKWSKSDFNSDGLTDLFVNIYPANERPMILVIIATNNIDSYKIISLNPLRSNCEFGYTEKIENIQAIILNRKDNSAKGKDVIINDTLQYSNLINDFIEIKNPHPAYTIQTIEFSTDHCFGSCPIFSLAVDNKGIINYDAMQYNELQGKFKAVLSTATKDSLFQLLNDIDFANLKDKYAVSWTDQQTAVLKINYNNGKIKEISDYGMKGNFSLTALYTMLLSLRNTQQWEKQ
jgi:hypothetical protein